MVFAMPHSAPLGAKNENLLYQTMIEIARYTLPSLAAKVV